jgi:hypothetical protein
MRWIKKERRKEVFKQNNMNHEEHHKKMKKSMKKEVCNKCKGTKRALNDRKIECEKCKGVGCCECERKGWKVWYDYGECKECF